MKPRYFILVTSPTPPLAWITGAIFSYFSAEQESEECQVILCLTLLTCFVLAFARRNAKNNVCYAG